MAAELLSTLTAVRPACGASNHSGGMKKGGALQIPEYDMPRRVPHINWKCLLGCAIAASALTLAACDPGSVRYDTVERIAVVDNIPYARVVGRSTHGIGMTADTQQVFGSPDAGANWNEILSPPAEVTQALNQAIVYPRTVCATSDPTTCFRISGEERIEISRNGGATWRVDWRMPAGRGKYQNRFMPLGVSASTVPLDLGIVETARGFAALAALGNQGILARSPDGKWLSYPVSLAAPVPLHATGFDAITDLKLLWETRAAEAVSLAYLVVLSLRGWRILVPHLDPNSRGRRTTAWLLVPFLVASGAYLLLAIVAIFALLDSPQLCLLPLAGLAVTWLLLAGKSANSRIGYAAAVACLAYALLLFLVAWLSYVLWAYGVIPIYGVALFLALVLGMTVAVCGWRHETRLARAATLRLGEVSLPGASAR